MQFIESRGNDGIKPKEVSFSEAILNPSASFGGIFVPKSLPKFDMEFLKKHLTSSYSELAYAVLQEFDIDIDDVTVRGALERYSRFDDPQNPVPLQQIEEDCFVMELYHGLTRALSG